MTWNLANYIGWLGEYVKRGFYYVAFRYEPSLADERGDGSLRAETVRISFPTPVPFYPYREPEHAPSGERKLRAVELWVASPSAVVPVALATDGSEAWVRPFREGLRRPNESAKWLGEALGPDLVKLLPEGDLVVQPFQDQKTQRAGFGDVVFLPEAGVGDDPGARAFVRATIGHEGGAK